MTNAISHRGPDAAGEYLWSQGEVGVALGHRRLSIIDLTQGQQPMSNEDDTIWVVFNGEIYNYREIRERLIARGHRLKMESDTEVLVHLYEDMGPDLVHELRGMFAFAIWDQQEQQLLIARDRLGQKPLIFRSESDRFLFASEIKSILQLPGLPREINRQVIDEFLTFQYIPHNHCIFEGYEKLLPGHLAVWKRGKLTIKQYWQAPFEESDCETPASELSFDEAKRQLRDTLTEAVRLRLRSDVPLGAFLSGGIDSTIITGLMQSQVSNPIETFSIGFTQQEYDERSYAQEVAKSLGTRHHEHIVHPSALDTLPKLIWHYEEPFADSSAIPTMALCEVTSQSVKVALSGDGGDELFAGYDRYQAVRLGQKIDQLPMPVRKFLTHGMWQKLLKSVHQKSFLRRLKRFQASASLEPRLRYLEWISYFKYQERQSLYTSEFARSIQGDAAQRWLFSIYDRVKFKNIVNQTAAVDQISYLPGDILTKVDIASMAFGLECRSPFLDHHVASLAARLPLQYKMNGRIGKYILRETFKDLIPSSVMQRPKMGFGVPVGHWFRNELKPLLYDYLLSEKAVSRGYFQKAQLQSLVEEHTQSRQDHSSRLWALLVLEAWHRVYLDSPHAPGHSPVTL